MQECCIILRRYGAVIIRMLSIVWEIQYGTSFGYPTSAMGAHVSAVPNHQTGRTVPLCTRSVVAMAGSFGYELDLGKLSKGKEEIRQENKKFKKYASLIQQGVYYDYPILRLMQ